MKKDRKIRVLYDYQVLEFQRYGGISRYFYELYSYYQKEELENVEVDLPVFYSQNYYFSAVSRKREKYPGRVARCINAFKAYISILYNYICGHPYDIIHPTYYNPVYLKFVPRFVRKKSKIIITVHDLIYEKFYAQSAKNDNRRKIIESADGIITISENTKKDLLEEYPEIDEKKVTVIYHGNFMKKPEKKLKIKFPEKYILIVGNRDEYKNGKIVFEAFKEIKDKNPELNLFCVGGGAFSKEEGEIIKKLGIQESIVQMNLNDDELYYAYRGALCFVFPSLYEGFGIPILEAFFCQCPIILSDASCFPEIAEEASLYFQPLEVKDLVKKIEMVLEDKELVQEMVDKGLNRLQEFTLETTAVKTLEFYKKIIQ